MSSELVQLDQRDTSVHGRRYTDEERAAAYLYWRTIAGKSCRKVAIRFGIDHRTVLSWRHAEGWDTRALEDDQDDFSSAHIGVSAIVVNELVPSIETARQIRDDPSAKHKDRLAAAIWIAGLAGVSPVSRIDQAVTDKRGTVVEVMPNFDTMEVEEIRAWELSKRPKRSE